MQDASPRLIKILQNVGFIASEDTRKTKIFLDHFNIKKKCVSLEKYNEASRINFVIDYLNSGKDMALVSEAGTPNIADPGAYLVSEVHKAGLKVILIPGPAAVTGLLSVSGFLADKFIFGGFFSKKAEEAKTLLEKLVNFDCPIVFYESGKRLENTLNIILEFDKNTEVFAGKELTKIHENYFFGKVEEVALQIKHASLKGEWCFVIKLSKKENKAENLPDLIEKLKAKDFNTKQILYICADIFKIPKNLVYKRIHGK